MVSGGLTETKNKDTGKGMLKLIITEDKHGLVWGYLVKTKNTGRGFRGGGDYVNHSRKIYVCVCIYRTEIRYLENKNGHGWVQLGWTVCTWGRGFLVCHSVEKLWLGGGGGYASHKKGITLLSKYRVFKVKQGWDRQLWKVWIEEHAA